MRSSYRIIKSTEISKNTVIAPPIIEIISKKLNGTEIGDENNNSIDLNEIYKSIEVEARQEAVRIIEDAKNEANNIIKECKGHTIEIYDKSKEDGYQAGYQEGYKSGYELGMNEAKKEASGIINDAEDYLKACQLESRRYIKECEDEIINLSMDIAKKIINMELTINTEAILKISEKVISSAVDKKQIVLKVSPEDYSIVKNRRDELSMFVEDSNNIIVIADKSLSQGSVKAETPSGFIDGEIETQLNEMFKKLIEV